jgi:ADP-heptose:LPS heptosyltransferase
MKSLWNDCKNILIIRPDNMGDIIMMTPALKALKKNLDCKVTMLTSKAGSLITPYIEDIDETIIVDLPWVKTVMPASKDDCLQLIDKLKRYQFDAAIISTVYSQNPLPAAMMAFMAGIPRRIAYCRENPYDLLTVWLPDKEPLWRIHHQVIRELKLLEAIGIYSEDKRLCLSYSDMDWNNASKKMIDTGIDIDKKWILIHPGVSEAKREYPVELWIETIKLLQSQQASQIVITGAEADIKIATAIQQSTGQNVFSLAGLLNVGEFISVVSQSCVVVSVNTATVHIAAAMQTPVVVLYAQTNPQHTPWKVLSAVLPFGVAKSRQSKNEIIQFVQKEYYNDNFIKPPSPQHVVKTVTGLLNARLSERRKKLLLLPA